MSIFLSIVKFIFIVLEVVFLFNLLIVVHELGHYLAARWRGLVIEKFAIWFGKPLWQKNIGGIEYMLGSIPAGGFVALPQMAPMEALEGKSNVAKDQLPPVSARDKIIVAFAGPLFSFSLALVFAVIVWIAGRPVSEAEQTTTIGYMAEESPAQKAGLEVGDKILEVDGYRVRKFVGLGDSIAWRVMSSHGNTIPIMVERKGRILTFEVEPIKHETKSWARKSLRQILIGPAMTPVIGKVMKNSPAARAGLKPNDQVLRLDSQPLISTEPISKAIEAHPTEAILLTIQRGDQIFDVHLIAKKPIGEATPRIGILWDLNGRFAIRHPNPIEQIHASVMAMVNTIMALVSSESDIKAQHLSGPVGIMRYYYILFESEHGWRLALWFSVIINVNLALINLVPIPILDGGHILLALFEKLRGHPLSARILEIVNTSFAVLIIGYMLYITFYDVQDLPWQKAPKKTTEMEFAPD